MERVNANRFENSLKREIEQEIKAFSYTGQARNCFRTIPKRHELFCWAKKLLTYLKIAQIKGKVRQPMGDNSHRKKKQTSANEISGT